MTEFENHYRARIIRKADRTTTKYQMRGYFLSEKVKRALRARGLKTDQNTWAEVFPHSDVVYRFNPEKNKSDVFIGTVEAVRYASGKIRNLKMANYFEDKSRLYWNLPDSLTTDTRTFVVSSDEVRYTPKAIRS